MSRDRKPIGVFDSGIGGLTVVKRLFNTLPNEDIIYFGDTARVPYGSKSNETVIEYAIQNTRLLLEYNIKALVVACNTVSAVAIPVLKEKFDIPVIDMIAPGSNYAIKESFSNNIGIIGTRATINNKAYSKALLKINSKLKVIERACPLFVPLAEEGLIEHPATYAIAEDYLRDFISSDIDTLILGCTHYPILASVIQKVVGNKVKLIDSGVAAAGEIKKILIEAGVLSKSSSPGKHTFLVSDIPVQFKFIAELFFGHDIGEVKKVETN